MDLIQYHNILNTIFISIPSALHPVLILEKIFWNKIDILNNIMLDYIKPEIIKVTQMLMNIDNIY